MDRRERIVRDRAETAKRALIKGRYLTGKEIETDWTEALLLDLLTAFTTDLFHLAASNGVAPIRGKLAGQSLLAAGQSFQAEGGNIDWNN